MKRIRQIGPIEWKREILGAQKLRLHFLIEYRESINQEGAGRFQ